MKREKEMYKILHECEDYDLLWVLVLIVGEICGRVLANGYLKGREKNADRIT